MPRRRRTGIAGIPHHVINRASRRTVIFGLDDDYRTFEELLIAGSRKYSMRVLDFSIMPNHLHLILWPDEDLQLSRFMQWLTGTQTQRWHAAHGTTGTGPLYQGRFKAIPVQCDRHFLTLARYVERNPVRALLCRRVENWRWSSAWHRCNSCNPFLSEWPVPMPSNWLALANEPIPDEDLAQIRQAVAMNWPYGDAQWTREMAIRFAMNRALRFPGRPPKHEPLSPLAFGLA
jgi:REP-associated tyrosine transposase